MNKFLLVLLLGFSSCFSFAADIWTPGYVFDTAANTGVDVWYGPGNKVTTNGAFARGANVLNAAGGAQIVEKGSVLLRDGRSVTLSATRLATAGSLATAAAKLASGPYGIVAALALPALYDWIAADNAQNIRVNSGRTGVEKKDTQNCTSAPCYEFRGPAPNYLWSRDSCQTAAAVAASIASPWRYVVVSCTPNSASWVAERYLDGAFYDTNVPQTLTRRDVTPLPENWLPSSMDDISPYMTVRLPVADYARQIVEAGGEIDVSPVSITGPEVPLVQRSPSVRTTQYPAPSPVVSHSTQAGNPYGLANNTPTQTGSSTGTRSVNPGSSVTSGPVPSGSSFPTPVPIKSPSSTTSISTFNPVTNSTSTTSSTTVSPQTQVTNITNATNISNTSNTSTVTNSSKTTTTITNNITNETTTITDDTPVVHSPDSDPSVSENEPATDTPFSDVPEIYQAKYPDGFAGVWAVRKNDLKATSLVGVLDDLMPSIGAGGACPSWLLPLDLGPWSYGSYDVAPPCWLWDVAKAIVILSALLLARALIFGG